MAITAETIKRKIEPLKRKSLKPYFGIFRRFGNDLADLFGKKRKFREILGSYFTKEPFDIVFFIIVIVLLAIGVSMMFSSSYVYALYYTDDSLTFLIKQAKFAVIGIILMIIVSHIKTDVLRDSSAFIFLIALLFLILVLKFHGAPPGKESYKRWLGHDHTTWFQPSEIAKVALVMFLSFSMELHKKLISKRAAMMWCYAVLVGAVCLLVAFERHVSGTIIMFAIGLAMMFFGGIDRRWFVFGAAVLILVGIVGVLNSERILDGYANERIIIWRKLLHNQELTSDEKRNEGWQILQSLIAVGSGGFFGLGFGKSRQKFLFLPEPQNDFVFSIVCEELGFVGAIIIMLIFIALMIRGVVIAVKAKSKYGSLLALGITFHVFLQAGLNMAVVTGTIPNTGIELPFFSYGGTAMIMLLVEMGMVLGVSRNSERKINNA